MNAEPETASAPAEATAPDTTEAAEAPETQESESPQSFNKDSYYREKRLREAAENKLRSIEDAKKKAAVEARETQKAEATALEKQRMEHEDALTALTAKHARDNLDSQTRFELQNFFANPAHINGLMQELNSIEDGAARTEAIQAMAADPANAPYLKQQQTQQTTTTATPPFTPPSAGNGGGPPAQDLQTRLSSEDKAIKRTAYTEYATGIQNGTYSPNQFKI